MNVLLFTDIASTDGYGKYAGTYKVASEVRASGYTCQVVDNFSYFTNEQLEQIATKFCSADTLLVGFSCTLSEKRVDGKVYNFGRPDEDFKNLVSYIKSINPNIKICLGGARININSYWEGVDYTILNKGDVALIKLLDHIKTNSEIKTIKSNPCQVIDGNDYFYTQEQFASSMIRYEDNDIIFPNEALPVEIARGCIFKCAFCRFDLIGKKIGDWTKHEDCLRQELMRNYEKFGTTHFIFTDELINESVGKMKMIHRVFTALPFKITYSSYARLDLIWKFPEMREMLYESGAVSLNFGIETMNDEAGKKIGKALGSKRTKETLDYCKELWQGKVITSSNFIVGLPGESKESILETVNWLVSDECTLDVFGFMPLFLRESDDGRQSNRIEREPDKFGYNIVVNESWKNDNMSFAEASKLAYEISIDPRVKAKSKIGSAIWIGRILNLGYSLDDLYQTVFENNFEKKQELSRDIKRKSIEKKAEYYNALMAL
jgi:hypothetical protein